MCRRQLCVGMLRDTERYINLFAWFARGAFVVVLGVSLYAEGLLSTWRGGAGWGGDRVVLLFVLRGGTIRYFRVHLVAFSS